MCSNDKCQNKFYFVLTYRTWENFGGGKFWQINGSKVFGEEKFDESVGSILKILAFINISGENFGKLPTVHQIRQNFPPPKFSHVRYLLEYNINLANIEFTLPIASSYTVVSSTIIICY